jgi:hypothetical protein
MVHCGIEFVFILLITGLGIQFTISAAQSVHKMYTHFIHLSIQMLVYCYEIYLNVTLVQNVQNHYQCTVDSKQQIDVLVGMLLVKWPYRQSQSCALAPLVLTACCHKVFFTNYTISHKQESSGFRSDDLGGYSTLLLHHKLLPHQ